MKKDVHEAFNQYIAPTMPNAPPGPYRHELIPGFILDQLPQASKEAIAQHNVFMAIREYMRITQRAPPGFVIRVHGALLEFEEIPVVEEINPHFMLKDDGD